MRIDGIAGFLTGRVRFAAENGIGERLLNLCSDRGICLFRLVYTPEGFCATVSARDYPQVEALAGQVNVELTVLHKQGLRFRVARYRHRWGLFVGAVLMIGFFVLMQNTVWTIRVEGNQTVATETVLSVLSDMGVRRFALIPNLNFRLLKQEALLRMPQLSWLAINREGSTITVSVAERRLPPLVREKTPCHVVAAKTGQIRYIEVYEGQKVTEASYTVTEGQLLVSGLLEGKNGQITPVHASAKVIAEVQFEKTLFLDLEQVTREYTGKTKTRHFLRLFSFRLPLFVALPLQGDYEVDRQFTPFRLFGVELPIGIYTEHIRFYENSREPLTLQEGDEILKKQFAQYEAVELADSAILERRAEERLVDGVLYRKICYTAEENIARQVPIA